jgi:hypothetical protein
MISILSFLLVRGLKINSDDKLRLCLVKTIGKHDSVFLILLYGLVVLILSTVDFFATSYYGALGAIFFLHALIIFPGLMENRYWFGYITSFLMILGMCTLTFYIMKISPNPYPRENTGNSTYVPPSLKFNSTNDGSLLLLGSEMLLSLIPNS